VAHVNSTLAVPSDVARQLGYYVYVYVNPLDGEIFYVGKGKGARALSHLGDRAETRKVAILRQIRSAGKQPRIEILAHRLRSAETALQVEAAVIDTLGIPFLTNRVRGWHSALYGRRPLDELIALYRRRPVQIREPSILIRITELYRPQMTPVELYDATRASWKIGPRRECAKFAFAVFEGIVREVYEITKWLPAGSSFNSRNPRGDRAANRWEFVGRLAAEKLRRRYINRDVSGYFKKGAQSPIYYVNVRVGKGRKSWLRTSGAGHRVPEA
jgi:uncharacterized protein